MNLFGYDETLNLLPHDGVVNYYGPIIDSRQSQNYKNHLISNIDWKNDEAFIYGKHIVTKRKAAWYGDDSYQYTYSNTTKQALPWTDQLLELKEIVESKTGTCFNSCLLNLYHDGNEGMSWHSDDEEALATNAPIASLSFGATRKFSFKHKQSKETVCVELEAGSLLIMKGEIQKHWLHSLPKTTKVTEPRINLTFRKFTR